MLPNAVKKCTEIIEFQSSPGPKAGCFPYIGILNPDVKSFNPHPARKPGASKEGYRLHLPGRVSILTRPESRVLPKTGTTPLLPFVFQSSPGPKAGCFKAGLRPNPIMTQVSILTPARKPGASERKDVEPDEGKKFQSSPGPKAGCFITKGRILDCLIEFQSSPGPKAGCFESLLTMLIWLGSFNPHPARKPGASRPIAGSAESRPGKSFNPHPARKPGASQGLFSSPRSKKGFNPHPARKPGASDLGPCQGHCHPVSILTRPESRVLMGDRPQPPDFTDVSILTRPESRVLPSKSCPLVRWMPFQSSPGPKAGCFQRLRCP